MVIENQTNVFLVGEKIEYTENGGENCRLGRKLRRWRKWRRKLQRKSKFCIIWFVMENGVENSGIDVFHLSPPKINLPEWGKKRGRIFHIPIPLTHLSFFSSSSSSSLLLLLFFWLNNLIVGVGEFEP